MGICLSIATAGYLSGEKYVLSIATDGYLYYDVTPPIVIVDDKKPKLYGPVRRIVRNIEIEEEDSSALLRDDEDILTIIKVFLQCQSEKN
jgi:hypothetical protein